MAAPDPSMFPELPADLAALTDEALTGLLDEFANVAKLVSARDEDTLGERTAEQIVAEYTAGVEAIEAIKAEQTARAEAEENFQTQLAQLTTRAGVEETPEGDDDEGDDSGTEEGDGEETPAPAEAVLEPVAASAKSVRRPDRKSTRLNSSHIQKSRMPSSA